MQNHLRGVALMCVFVVPVAAQVAPPQPVEPTSKPAVKRVKAKRMRAMRLAPMSAKRRELTADELQQRFAAKMAEAWVKKAEWVTDYGKARAMAKKSGKLIFAYFTRSYAP